MSPNDRKIVSDAVAAAEQTTSGEIVPVIADRSDGYTDVAFAWAAGLAFSVQTLLVLFPDPPLRLYESLHGTWNAVWLPHDVFGVSAAIGILVFFLAFVLQLWTPLRFKLIPAIVKTNRVEEKAIELFKVGAESRTRGHTGVLIYLSMQEHRAEIVADRSILEKVEPEAWGEAMADMLAEIAQGKIAEGLAAGIRDVGVILSRHFPPEDEDRNELPDRLIEV